MHAPDPMPRPGDDAGPERVHGRSDPAGRSDGLRDPASHGGTRSARDPRVLARRSGVRFQAAIRRSALVFDDGQRAAIAELAESGERGVYVWGGVGRGKTMLGEAYLAAVPTRHKRRFHFHDFFRDLQRQIFRRRAPLAESVRSLIGDAQAVLFDEFHVHDVADGVYLTATLQTLVDDGVLVIATSNYAPERLMPNPLHHGRFEPAIGLIRTALRVVHIGDGDDHRLALPPATSGFRSGSWIVDADPVGPDAADGADLDAGGHRVRARRVGADGGTFAFRDLCEVPLGPAQYLWLAEHLPAIELVAVPDLATVGREALARFASVVEVLHDRDVPLHVRAGSDPERLTAAAEPPRESARVLSRLALLRTVRHARAETHALG